MGREDEKLIRKAKDGSRKAFDELVRQYLPRVFRLLYDMTGNYEDAQDLTQETFIKVYTSIDRFRGEAKFSTWLYRIAYNAAIDFRRQKKRVNKVSLDSEYSTLGRKLKAPEVEAFSGEGDAVEAALQKLTESQRTAVVLNYYHGLRMKEIAEIIGCSESTVRVHLFRALRRLRQELRDFSSGA